MNAITPENEIPPAHSTAASGTLPIEHTNESTATSGPTITFSGIRIQAGASVRKSPLKKLIGSSATKPAITNPAPISFQSISQSPRKFWATSVQASTEVNRRRQVSPSEPAEWCSCPVCASCAFLRASSSSLRVTKSRIPAHMKAIRSSPPTNSASVNSQPRKIHITIPSSKTRFVDANWNAIAETRLAPFCSIDFAIATAA